MRPKQINTFLLVMSITIAITIQSCTKIESEVYSNASAENFPQTERDLLSLVGASYGTLRGYVAGNIQFVSETSTDEIVVPTRGSGWYDQGTWRQEAEHNWNAVSPGHINGSWEFCYSGIANINLNIANLKNSPIQVAGKEIIISELRVLRAFYYYLLCDLFGSVPLITENSPAGNIAQHTRSEAFSFIESEIKEALPNLNAENTQATYGKVTQGFANGLLAKLYVNAEVFTGTPKWSECIAACDAVINSGKYGLVGDYMQLFKVNNDQNGANRENIFVIPFDKTHAPGNHLQMQTLPPGVQQKYGLSSDPWGGFCTYAEFFNNFSEEDNRKRQWLFGPQYGNDGKLLKLSDYVDGTTKDLILTPQIDSFGRALLNQGVRSVKYEIQQNNPTSIEQDNDFAVLRYADVVLMKAEASLKKGDAGTALILTNSIRQRAGLGNLSAITLDALLEERGRELVWENWRRNDLIRFGKWEDNWNNELKFVKRNEPYRRIFPIPAIQLSKNPSLKQNPGY